MVGGDGAQLPADVLPFGERELLALLGPAFSEARLVEVTPVALRSRNRLYRVRLTDAPAPGLVLKVLGQQVDRFWEHHLRREHWLLQLLTRFWPGGAPRPYAAVFGGGWGLLVMEDAGSVSLAAQLASGQERQPLLAAGLAQVASLHAILQAQQPVFRRVCESIELDRISSAALLARARVARSRLVADDRRRPHAGIRSDVLQAYQATVVRPLIAGRRQMIHNSLSPLNVVMGPAPRLVDWETMAFAAPEFDVAELLRYPDARLDWVETDRLVRQVFEERLDLTRLRLAALTRAIDYAGSNAEQERRSLAEGDVTHAATAAGRRHWYAAEARAIAREVGVAAVVDEIIG